MKLYWLKRLALKWLVNDRDFYFIMNALRGPDIVSLHLSDAIKIQSTGRIRYKVGLNGDNGAVISDGTPLEIENMTDIVIEGKDEEAWYHFDGHIKSAIASLWRTGYRS